MCGRFYLDVDFEEVMKHYFGRALSPIEYEPREIFPSNQVPVVRAGEKGPKLTMMKWGFAPPYMKRALINARSETIAEKRTFKNAFFQRRCLIPASGFYEWEEIPGQKKKAKRAISVPDQSVISLAAIYDRFVDEEGKSYWGFTILTKDANEDVAKIHDRMPVILTADQEKLWIADYDIDYTPLFEILKHSSPKLHIENV